MPSTAGVKLCKIRGKGRAKRIITKAIKNTILGIIKPVIRRIRIKYTSFYDGTRVVLRSFFNKVQPKMDSSNFKKIKTQFHPLNKEVALNIE